MKHPCVRLRLLVCACLLLFASASPAAHKDPARARPLVALAAKEADVHGLARLFSSVTGQNMVVPGTVEGRVSLRSARVPWNRVWGMVLGELGCGFRWHGSFLIAGEPEEIKASIAALHSMGRRSGIPAGTRITLDFVRADLADVLVLFSEVQGVKILAGKGLGAKVTVQVRNTRCRHALEAILLACGMGMKKTKESIRVGRFASLAGDASGFAPVEPDPNRTEPDPHGVVAPAERYELGALRLTAVVSGISRPQALVEAPDGDFAVLKKGTRVGKQHARVVEIRPEALLLEETSLDAAGGKAVKRYRMALGGRAVERTGEQ